MPLYFVLPVSLPELPSNGYFVGEMFFTTFSFNNGATVVQHLPRTRASTVDGVIC
jgi:hypothetical protein